MTGIPKSQIALHPPPNSDANSFKVVIIIIQDHVRIIDH